MVATNKKKKKKESNPFYFSFLYLSRQIDIEPSKSKAGPTCAMWSCSTLLFRSILRQQEYRFVQGRRCRRHGHSSTLLSQNLLLLQGKRFDRSREPFRGQRPREIISCIGRRSRRIRGQHDFEPSRRIAKDGARIIVLVVSRFTNVSLR